MGQTLTHGIYLPDEGERNCYDGLAGNWQLLDGAVGTVAEHTTALAGKAPLVHTHTKADITDFPVYGNVAGTICEGNDSRLSDARTPVAHTHGKADITDLLNSNFIPSANNSYDLGSSSYQWKSVYAQSYYYNGVAWGLDKENTWSGNNIFTNHVTIMKNSVSPTTRGDASLSFFEISNYIFFRTRGSSNIKSYNSFLWGGYLNGSAPYRYGRIRIYRASALYGETGEETPDTSFSFIDVALHYKWVSLTDNVRFINDGTANACEPLTNNTTDLGTSDNKWKTINGINPGALSLPDSNYDPISTQNWIKRPSSSAGGFMCNIVPSVNGWICIQVTREKDFGVWVVGTFRQSFRAVQTSATTYVAMIFFPALAASSINIYTNSVETDDADLTFNIARIYPCLGNV